VKKILNLSYNFVSRFVNKLSMKKILFVLLVCLHAIETLGQEGNSFELKGQLTGFADSVPVRLFRSGENAPFFDNHLAKAAIYFARAIN